jgi:ribosomal protein S12 methylthiotransferase accessory factor
VERFADRFGVTRVADVTGLDYLGVPVFMAMRPNARSLSVSQGKGLDGAAARASAFMEACELWHAEHARPTRRPASWSAMAKHRPIAFDLLPRLRGGRLQPDESIRWTDATDLRSGRTVPVPFDLVHADYRARGKTTSLLMSTNGLASGNHLLEATCAALCEVIERDALACWQYRGPKDRAARRLSLAGIADHLCHPLVEHLSTSGMEIAAWNLTTDIGVPVFLCRLGEATGNDRSRHGDFWGAGCHSTREVALVRAITEAVQTRLTYIAGSRDDLLRRNYATRTPNALEVALNLWEQARGATDFAAIPSERHDTFDRDLQSLLDHLARIGANQVLRVDLTSKRFGIPVVRIIVPGLESWTGERREATGARIKALKKAQQ